MKNATCTVQRFFHLFKIGLVLGFLNLIISTAGFSQTKSVSRSIDTTLHLTHQKSVSNAATAPSSAYPLNVSKNSGEQQVTHENGFYSKIPANVSKVDAFMAEVNRDCPQYNGGSYRETAIDCLNRTLFHKVPVGQYPECPLLSTAMKKNKCNPDMTYDFAFDADTFNPLKYHFMYFSPNSSFYRIDGTEYIIEIVPQKH